MRRWLDRSARASVDSRPRLSNLSRIKLALADSGRFAVVAMIVGLALAAIGAAPANAQLTSPTPATICLPGIVCLGPTPTATATATDTATATATDTATATATATDTATATATATNTATATATATPTATATATATATQTATPTQTTTATPTSTATATPTATATRTATPSATATPKLTVSVATLAFPQQEVDTTSAAKNVTLSNPSSSSVMVFSTSISGDYSISSDGCSGTTLAASGGSCVVSVTFTPSQTGTETGTLTFTDAAGNSPQHVNLTGKGILVKPTFSPASLAFGTEPVDVASASKTITLTNPNKVPLSVNSVVSTAADYAVVNDTCSGTSVPAGGTCTFGVVFTPSQTGSESAKINVTDDAYIPTQSIAAAGTGIIVTPTVSPTRLSYGKVQINTVSAPQTVTLSNSNEVAVNFSSIATSGPYAITANSCGSSVPAKSTCQVSVTFNPTTDSNASGTTETGTLTFTDNGQHPTQTVSLTGIAFGSTATPTATATGGTPTATATATLTATATMTATNSTTPSATATATVTSTATSSGTPTATSTATQTSTASATPTATASPTSTATSTASATQTATATPTATTTATSSATQTATATATPTSTTSATQTATATATPTATMTATASATQTATASASVTSTATSTASATATATPTASSTATATATSTPTATATSTATATPTSTGSGSPTATATSTPGPQAGDILVAGGDQGGSLNNIIPLATSTNSTASSEIYEALTDTFGLVGPLNTAREATATAVVLPNGKTLIVGGSHCASKTYGPGGLCGTTTFNGFQCDALNTAELYSETTSTTGSFTFAGSGSGGVMTTARSGGTATLITGSGTALDGKVLITGGSTGSMFLALTAPPPGCGPFGQVAQNTAEIYDPVADTFTATGSIPGCPAGESASTTPSCTTGLPSVCGVTHSAISTASESGTTVTITMSTANPTGLIVGDNVTVTGVAGTGAAGYNGTFVVTAIPSGTTFQYTDTSGLTAGTGGFAAADTAQCGLVDSEAALLNNGQVLVAGGDYIQFLGQSSPQAFVFNPGAATFSETAQMNVARELPGILTLPNGDVLVTGGLTGAAAGCLATPSTPVAVVTNASAEVYDPTVPSWTLTSGSSATPGAAGGMNVKRIGAGELFTSGDDMGLAIFAGGIEAHTAATGSSTSNFPICESIQNIHQTTQTETDLYDPSTTDFTATTHALNQSRGGYAFGILTAGPNAGDFVAIGGECASGGLASYAIGSSGATACDSTAASDYYELFTPAAGPGAGTWTVGKSAPASTPANAPTYTLLP